MLVAILAQVDAANCARYKNGDMYSIFFCCCCCISDLFYFSETSQLGFGAVANILVCRLSVYF
uniref:Uncharacterized protein n=1 Tax=Anguilla anguilla TaxID=7936 RepID=A0A0E9X553_ANGAN